MILRDLLQLVLFIGLLAALSPLLGRYVHQVFSGRRTFLHPVLGPVERGHHNGFTVDDLYSFILAPGETVSKSISVFRCW